MSLTSGRSPSTQVWTRAFSSQATLAGSRVLRCLPEAQVEEPRIMVFGRWGSSAVRKYVRVAGLAGISSNLAREVVIRSFKPSSDLVKVNTSAGAAATTHEGPTPFAVRCRASGRATCREGPRVHALWLELVFRPGHIPASCTRGDWQLVQTLCKSRGPT